MLSMGSDLPVTRMCPESQQKSTTTTPNHSPIFTAKVNNNSGVEYVNGRNRPYLIFVQTLCFTCFSYVAEVVGYYGDFEKSMFYDTIQIMFGRGPRKETSTQPRTPESTEHVSGRVLREVCRSLQQHDPERQRKERISFLKTTRAIPLDADFYALWLYSYIENEGGIITHQEKCNYPLSTCRADDRQKYYSQQIFWAPGENEEGQIPKIPVDYDSNALTIMHFPDIIRLDLDLEDNPKQHYGHTTLLTLQLDP